MAQDLVHLARSRNKPCKKFLSVSFALNYMQYDVEFTPRKLRLSYIGGGFVSGSGLAEVRLERL